MPEPEEERSLYRRRSADSGIQKYLLPVLLGLLSTFAVGAFSFAWGTAKDVALLKAQQGVNPIEFAKMQVKIEQLEAEAVRQHGDFKDQLNNLREWMRRSGRGQFEPPPAADAAVAPRP
jgi:hypothetical protein